jgi:hypothetical protein
VFAVESKMDVDYWHVFLGILKGITLTSNMLLPKNMPEK